MVPREADQVCDPEYHFLFRSPYAVCDLSWLDDAAFAFLLGIQSLYRYFSGTALEGFTTVILLLLIIGSILMISLGIIGHYISRIYDEIKARPRYLISKRCGF